MENWKYLIIQFIKFGIVGVSNTFIGFSTEMFFYYIVFSIVEMPENIKIVISSGIAFFVSATNSYFLNSKYVFQPGKKTIYAHIKSYTKSIFSYGLTGLVISPILKIVIVTYIINYYWLASIISLFISIPINFVMNKFWAFKKEA